MDNNTQSTIASKKIPAGNRTYFFDTKKTINGDFYLTITESKRVVGQDDQSSYQKNRIFVYKEDFEKVLQAFTLSVKEINTLNENG